jgi:CRP-like cAMP-binding protein
MNLLEVFKDSDHLVSFPAGQVILREGEPGDHMYVVMKGELSITITGKLIATASPGDIVGEMALINSETRSATVAADTDCVLADIDRSSFDSLLKYVPDFTTHVMNVLAGRLSTAYRLIER